MVRLAVDDRKDQGDRERVGRRALQSSIFALVSVGVYVHVRNEIIENASCARNGPVA